MCSRIESLIIPTHEHSSTRILNLYFYWTPVDSCRLISDSYYDLLWLYFMTWLWLVLVLRNSICSWAFGFRHGRVSHERLARFFVCGCWKSCVKSCDRVCFTKAHKLLISDNSVLIAHPVEIIEKGIYFRGIWPLQLSKRTRAIRSTWYTPLQNVINFNSAAPYDERSTGTFHDYSFNRFPMKSDTILSSPAE